MFESDQYQTFIRPIEVLKNYDIIINCVLQDPTNPMMFIDENDAPLIKKQIDIIDISCDKGMGFYFAEPTTFERPSFKVGKYINYYCIDHTPTLYWDS
ncbi:TPA: hypothetical protein ACM7BQ_004770, partial [Escherichia coli]